MMPNLSGGFLPLGQGDGCAQLNRMDLERKKNSENLVFSLKMGKSHIINQM
jgi:hypothetical protein